MQVNQALVVLNPWEEERNGDEGKTEKTINAIGQWFFNKRPKDLQQ